MDGADSVVSMLSVAIASGICRIMVIYSQPMVYLLCLFIQWLSFFLDDSRFNT